MAKGESILAIMKRINKQNGDNTIGFDLQFKTYERIPFSSAKLNYALYGGIPRGGIIQFWGDKGSGKTTTALDVVYNAQKAFKREYEEQLANDKIKDKPQAPKQVVYVDVENTLDEEWAFKLGVNLKEIIVMQPTKMYTEQILEEVINLIETGEVGLVVIDSIPMMLSKQAFEKKIEERTYAGNAMALTRFASLAVQACAETGCSIIGINQVRDKMDAMFPTLETTGGKAWGHSLVVDLFFKKGPFINERNEELKMSAKSPNGNIVMVDVVKTKICPPDRRNGSYTLNYAFGIDFVADTLDVAIELGYVIKAGAWYSITDPKTGEVLPINGSEKIQGFFNFCNAVYDNGMYEPIEEAVNANLAKFETPERMLRRKEQIKK